MTDTPSRDDLRQIAEFLRARSLDEAGAAGSMDYFGQNGVTIQGRFPKRFTTNGATPAPGDRAKVAAWLENHGPGRFMDMAHQLANLADGLADALFDVPEVFVAYRARTMWRALTGAARLWESHDDFDPAWAKEESGEA